MVGCFQLDGTVPHFRATTPQQLVHNHDEDDSDSEESPSSSACSVEENPATAAAPVKNVLHPDAAALNYNSAANDVDAMH